MNARGFHYIYRGTLTGTVNDVAAAQKYLTEDNMTRYLPAEQLLSVVHIWWNLHADGHTYNVNAISMRELTDEEIDQLTDWVKGQNSDGLGEGFEQQPFADLSQEQEDPEWWEDVDEHEPDICDYEEMMASFDWQTNETKFALVAAPNE